MDRPYPAHWEADVVLRDGGTAHLRPIRPDDADRLVDFYAKTSDESRYYRFFAPRPELSQRDVRWFTNVDQTARVALVALVGEEIIGVVRYDRTDGAAGSNGASADGASVEGTPARDGTTTAEVAFLVQDAHQGRGLASVLLEHLAAAARERGVDRFTAEVLPDNRRMLQVFREAGYAPTHRLADGVVTLGFAIAPTDTSVAVVQAREHRAESRSIERLLTPRAVAVVGAGRRPGSAGRSLLDHLVGGGFAGPVYAVNPAAADAGEQVAGRPAYRSVLDLPGPVDLAVLAVPVDAVAQVVADCGRAGVHGLVVVSAGYAETGTPGRERQRALVSLARANGMRVVGPNCLGLVNTAPAVALNASLAPALPPAGPVGLFAQSGALGIALLEGAAQRGLGLSSFVNVGNRADVSGNDLLQYWEEDPATAVVLLHLESFGNPRKFSRLARRIGRHKPVVVVRSGTGSRQVPVGHAMSQVAVPEAAVDALFRQAGVIQVPTVTAMFDVAQVLVSQPLPAGDRVAVVTNSDALGLLVADACLTAGLRPLDPVSLPTSATPADVADRVRQAVAAGATADGTADGTADAVVAALIPPLYGPVDLLVTAVREVAETAAEPVLAVRLGGQAPGSGSGLGARVSGTLPVYDMPEQAARALAEVTRYAAWRRRPAGTVPDLDGLDPAAARALVRAALAPGDGGPAPGARRRLDPETTRRLLACYGIDLWPAVPVRSADEAVAAAGRLGFPVALKALAPWLRHRADGAGVSFDLVDEAALRAAYTALPLRVPGAGPPAGDGGPPAGDGGQSAGDGGLSAGDGAELPMAVQAMAPRGVPVVVRVLDDPRFGAVASFGLAGVASELLGDLAYRILPLTSADAADLVGAVRAAPLLSGYRGAPPADVAAVTDVLLRVSRLAEDLPEVAGLELDPVLVAERGLAVLDAWVELAPPPARADLGPRALSQPG